MKMFPSSLKLKGMCIESRNFVTESELATDKNLCLNKINKQEPELKKILSEFNVNHQYSLGLNTNLRDYKKLSDIKELAKVETDKIGSNGFEFENENFNINFIDSGYVDGFLYWYELYGVDSRFYSPFENSILNKTNGSNKLAGIRFYQNNDEDTELAKVDSKKFININYLFKNGIFEISNFEISL